MDKEKRITVSVSENFHKAVRLKAVEQGRYVSDVVRKLLSLWIDGKIELPEEGEKPAKSD